MKAFQKDSWRGIWHSMGRFVAIFASALVCNLILTGATPNVYFKLGMAGQAVAHTDGLWNALGMLLVGFG